MTAWFNMANRWNSLISPPLGFILNFFLLWLILRRTPQEMQVHSRILLQTVGMDIAMLCVQTIGQTAYTFNTKQSMIINFFDGYLIRPFLAAFGHIGLYLLAVTIFCFNLFLFFGNTIQFIYRYLVLIRNIHVNLRRYLLLLAGPFVLVLFMAVVSTFYFLPISTIKSNSAALHNNSDVIAIFGNNLVDFQDNDLIYFFGTLEKIWASSIFFGAMVPIFMSTIVANFFLGLRMIRFVNQHTTFNPRLKELNRQLTQNLIILASFPLLIEICATILYTLLCIYLMSTAAKDVNIGQPTRITTITTEGDLMMMRIPLLFTLTLYWLPVLNPLASILVNRPYRDAAFSFFNKCYGTSVAPNIQQQY